MAKRFLVSAALVAVIFVALTGCGNHPPQITGVTAPSLVEPGDEATISCTATDADGDPLTYDWESVDEVTAYTGSQFDWIAPEELGDYGFHVTVSDGHGAVDSASLVIAVGYVAIPAVKLLPPLNTTTREVTLVWNRSDYPTWYEYKLYRSDEQENARENGKVIASIGYDQGKTRNDTIFLDKGLDPGTDYYYVVATIDSSDNMAFSNEIEVTTKSFYLVGTQSLGGGHGVRLANTGNYIFCAARERGVYGFTISPTGPVPGSVIPQPNNNPTAYAYDLTISGNLLHVAFGKAGYMAYDITNPMNPDSVTIVPASDLGGEARAVYALGDFIFVGCTDPATTTHTIVFFDRTNPGAILDIDTLHDEPTDVQATVGHIFVTVQDAGLEILSMNPGLNPVQFVSITSTNDAANRVYVSGSYAYVAASSEGLLIFDVATPSNPTKVAQWKDTENGNDAQGIYSSGGIAYVADGMYGLRIIDINYPGKPQYLGTITIGSKLMDVWVTSPSLLTQAILADWNNAIHMIEW